MEEEGLRRWREGREKNGEKLRRGEGGVKRGEDDKDAARWMKRREGGE